MQSYIFNRKYLSNHLKYFEVDNIEERHKIIRKWNYSLSESDLERTKEEAIQGDFLSQIFSSVLDYKNRIGEDLWNLQPEQKTEADGTKPDGSLGFFTSTIKDIRVVIELKDAKNDLDRKQNRSKNQSNQSPVEQAFGYQYKHKNCKWVIVSNFKEIRLYNSSTMMEYESFTMHDLKEDIEIFKKFYYLLSKDRLIDRDGKSKNDLLYENNEKEELEITKEFYIKYKKTRSDLYQHITDCNPDLNELVIFEKTQKILDRFIFVCFCEDTELLPENIFRQVIQAAKQSFDFSEERIWAQLKGLFHSIDKGNPNHNINRYNGGLFAPDKILDHLSIKDEIFGAFEEITEYNFDSELSVNILGHVFEQSISDMEEFKAEIAGKNIERNKGKRKRDGIFYTPSYITHFIVSKTMGDWLDDQKEKLGFLKLPLLSEYNKKLSRQEKSAATKAQNVHIDFWQNYQDVLRNIKVLDPACGSGAFLVQAFDFLIAEGERVNEELSRLRGGQITLFDLDKHILKNNLYGIDINKESIEITKLSLWIKTANKNDPLTSLDNNIKYGDSLIDDVFADEYFDVILGNPPYVRQELIGHLKHQLEEKYFVYQSGLDLFGYFYEKSLSFLKKDGYIGFISNNFNKTNSGINLRNFLKENTRFIYFVDFSDVQIFEGAITYPVVLVLKKEKKLKNSFKYHRIHKDELNALSTHLEEKKKTIIQKEIDNENWHFVTEEEKKMRDKFFSHPTIRKQFGKTYYGLKTGLNKAFIVEKNVYEKLSLESKEFLVPFLEGKDLKKWSIGKVPKWLIFIRKGWTKKAFGKDITEEKAKEFMERKYPELFKHLSSFEQDARKRSDSGDFWWELRSCDYTNLFEKTKIQWPNLQLNPKFSIDNTHGYYLNAPSVMLSTDQEWILGVLNSSLGWYILKSLCIVRNGGYIEVKPQFLEKFPVPVLKKKPVFLEEKVKEIVSKNRSIEIARQKFLQFIKSEYGVSKITKNLTVFFELSFKDFTKELQKQKIILTQQDKYELIDVFNLEKETIQQLNRNLTHLEKELNNLVYEIYELNEIEIDIINNTN